MFNLFKSNKNYIPLDEELRLFVEQNLCWMIYEFEEFKFEDFKVLTPTKNDFPIIWNGSEESIHKTIDIVFERMMIAQNSYELEIYSFGETKMNFGNQLIFLESDSQNDYSTGKYFGTNSEGKYLIGLVDDVLEKGTNLIAAIARIGAEIKLYGENRVKERDELFIDLVTVFFGFGIFNANSAFNYHQNFEEWSYQTIGYLTVEEWAYALAIYFYLRNEESEEAKWKKYLSKSLLVEFDKCIDYIFENEDSLFLFDDEENDDEDGGIEIEVV